MRNITLKLNQKFTPAFVTYFFTFYGERALFKAFLYFAQNSESYKL